MSDIKDILTRIEETNHIDDSWMDLKCRLTDCAEEITKLRAIIKEMQQVDDVLAPQKWISVDDRLPDDFEHVLCATRYEHNATDYVVCLMLKGKWMPVITDLVASNYDGGALIELDKDFKPTHWKKLRMKP